jgi:hypothetical protein
MASHDEEGRIPASDRRERRVMVIDSEPERRKTLSYGKPAPLPAAEPAVTPDPPPVRRTAIGRAPAHGNVPREPASTPKAVSAPPPTQPPRVRGAPDARMRQVLSPADVIDALRDEVLRLRRKKRDE